MSESTVPVPPPVPPFVPPTPPSSDLAALRQEIRSLQETLGGVLDVVHGLQMALHQQDDWTRAAIAQLDQRQLTCESRKIPTRTKPIPIPFIRPLSVGLE